MIGTVKGIGGSAWIPNVGYVWKSADPTSPAELYQGTTWAKIKDRTILAAGDTYTHRSDRRQRYPHSDRRRDTVSLSHRQYIQRRSTHTYGILRKNRALWRRRVRKLLPIFG